MIYFFKDLRSCIQDIPTLPLIIKNTMKSTIEKMFPINMYKTLPDKAYNTHQTQASIFW